MTHRLELTGITKAFGATKALDGVDLKVGAGEVHAVIGENGAGKSTLMKVLSGAHRPDAGVIRLDGKEVSLADPRQSQATGIAMIYQELNLAPDLSVVENITLGHEPTYAGWRRRTGLIDGRQQKQVAIEALERLHCKSLPLDRPISELSIAQQQMIEIARSVVTSSSGIDDSGAEPSPLKLLILDEPTSSLTQVDTEHLFAVIESLKQEGVSILYISHFLEECQQVADRFTVLRDGRSVGSGPMPKVSRPIAPRSETRQRIVERFGDSHRANVPKNILDHDKSEPGGSRDQEDITSMDEIIRLMVGRDVSQLYPAFQHNRGDVALEIDGVQGQSLPRGVSFKVHHGEIFGVAGLIGAGRTETLRTIFGLENIAAGRVVVHGRRNSSRTPESRTPRSSWGQDAMGLVSEDRKSEGLLLTRSLSDNLTMTRLNSYQRYGVISNRRMQSATQNWMDRLEVKASGPDQKIGELSGGNQQKIAFGRLLHHECDILLLDEPTRGIDIGSKETLYRLIGELAAQGKAILLVSSYLPELLGVCDTVGVFAQGKLTEVRNKNEWTEHELLSAAI